MTRRDESTELLLEFQGDPREVASRLAAFSTSDSAALTVRRTIKVEFPRITAQWCSGRWPFRSQGRFEGKFIGPSDGGRVRGTLTIQPATSRILATLAAVLGAAAFVVALTSVLSASPSGLGLALWVGLAACVALVLVPAATRYGARAERAFAVNDMRRWLGNEARTDS